MSNSQSLIPLRIDIVSDVVCPWCIIGYKQLQQALGQMTDSFVVEFTGSRLNSTPECLARGRTCAST
jgi:predicted DsbA family dithiol-disulfide isomerase